MISHNKDKWCCGKSWSVLFQTLCTWHHPWYCASLLRPTIHTTCFSPIKTDIHHWLHPQLLFTSIYKLLSFHACKLSHFLVQASGSFVIFTLVYAQTPLHYILSFSNWGNHISSLQDPCFCYSIILEPLIKQHKTPNLNTLVLSWVVLWVTWQAH